MLCLRMRLLHQKVFYVNIVVMYSQDTCTRHVQGTSTCSSIEFVMLRILFLQTCKTAYKIQWCFSSIRVFYVVWFVTAWDDLWNNQRADWLLRQASRVTVHFKTVRHVTIHVTNSLKCKCRLHVLYINVLLQMHVPVGVRKRCCCTHNLAASERVKLLLHLL